MKTSGRAFMSVVLTLMWTVGLAAEVGFTEQVFADQNAERKLPAFIWYPARGSAAQEVGRTAVYRGFSATRDAPLKVSKLPLIVLVHGSFGNRTSLSWLAVALADHGAIVVAASHPGSSTGDATPKSLIQMWHNQWM
jgi:predicted dienelactone hydrolase